MEKSPQNFYDIIKSGQVYDEGQYYFEPLQNTHDFDPKHCENPFTLENVTMVGCAFEKGKWHGTSLHKALLSGSYFSDLEISNVRGSEVFARLYTFSECHISELSMGQSDLSTGGFYKITWTQCEFNHVCFAHCEWQEVVFERCHFKETLFNGSYFENVKFIDCQFEGCEFKDVHGLSDENEILFSSLGVPFSWPFPYSLIRASKSKGFNIFSRKMVSVLVLLVVYVLGVVSPGIFAFVNRSFFLDANPILPMLNAYHRQEVSFFDTHIFLPNFDFSSGMQHWQFSQGTIGEERVISKDMFYSFPSSLKLTKELEGNLFYVRVGSTKKTLDIENEDIWVPVHASDRKLKFSFWYKNGHPRFQILGKLRDGGYSVLNEIESQTFDTKKEWIYFSESIELESSYSAVALVLDRFPQIGIYLDDVNIEKAV